MRKIKVAFVAPGQGIENFSDGLYLLEQYPEVVEPIYADVKEATGVDIFKISTSETPPDNISISQPAALGIGVAHGEVLKSEGVKPDYLIGFSSGEFVAGALSGALSLKDAAHYVQKRGESQVRVGGGKGGAITAIHRSPLDIEKIMHGLEGVWQSGFHSPNFTGFSFRNGSLETLKQRLEEQRAKIKKVSVPFPPHSPEVKKTQQELEQLILEGSVNDAHTAMISIRMARAMRKARIIRHNLIWQTTQPTRLNDSVIYALNNNVEDFYPLAPGDSVGKLLGNIIVDDNIRIHWLKDL